MPVEFWIDKRNNLVCRTVRGEVDLAEFMAGLEEAINHPDCGPGMKSLTDLREYVPQVTSGDIKHIAEYLLRDVGARRGMDAAVVVSQTVSYGMMRMLQTIADTPAFRISVFYDLDEAKEWLGVT